MTTIAEIETPALLVDLDRLERNIARMADVAKQGGKKLRPHTKTHKTPEIARMQVQAGASGLTVAKLGEAEVLADAGLDDLFVANQIVGALKIERLLRLAERVAIQVAVDSIAVAEPIGEAARRKGTRIPLRIEVDTGLRRAGTRSAGEALELARFIDGHPGLELAGIFTHEGHFYQAQDEEQRQATAANVADQMRHLATGMAEQGTPVEEISVGSTPGAPYMAREAGLTEIRPGVYVFNDRMQVKLGADPANCALTVLATVTSVRGDGRVVIDAGSKSLASDKPFADGTCGEIVGHSDLMFVGMSEEHGHLLAQDRPNVNVGDRLRIVPNHACTCVNMHDRLYAIRGEQVEACWNIAARGKIT